MRRIFRARDYRPRAAADLKDELQSHLELEVEDLMSRGLTEEEARARVFRRRRASEASRGRARAEAHSRSRLRRKRLTGLAETTLRDLQYALRRMGRSPGFTLVAILSLALGIGANTAVFSVVNAFLIRKAPFRAPEELVRIYASHPDVSPYMSLAYPDVMAMRDMSGVFSGVGASELLMTVADLGGEARKVTVEALSPGLLPMLGVEPALGRGFLPSEEGAPGEHPVVMLGHGFWRDAFGGDREILGRTVALAGKRFTVVGVAPEWFACTLFTGLKMDLFIPVTMSSSLAGYAETVYTSRINSRFDALARLAPGVTLEEAAAALEVLASQLREAYPETNRNRSFRAFGNAGIAVSPAVDQGLHLVAAFLLVVVGLVLLLACTNLASFLLARGVQRQREVAMRMTLGAGRGRLVRQLLTETLLLAFMGGVAGLVAARVTLAFVVAYQPPLPVSLSLELGLDRNVFLFTLGVSILAGFLFGLAPALRSTKLDLTPVLKEGGRGGVRKRLTLQNGLVALQVMMSMILLVGGGLFLRSLVVVQSTDPGFSTAEAGIAWVDLTASQIPREQWDQVRVDLEERLRSQPGIGTVTSASRLPLSLQSNSGTFRVPGVDPPDGQSGHQLFRASVSTGYFEALGVPIVAGRPFTEEDRVGSPAVAVVSQATVRLFWPGDDPLGKDIVSAHDDGLLTVVGVARDSKVNGLTEAPQPVVYLPSAQAPSGDLHFLVRGAPAPPDLVATLRRVIREAYPNLLVMEIKTMEDHLALILFGSRAAALLLGIFGALGLILSSIGLYGVVSFSVSARVREVGIRLSMGAEGSQVVGMIVGRAMGVVLLGALVGLGVAAGLTPLVRAFLPGVSPADPPTMVGVTLLLGFVAFVAALIPARRASRVDPVEALRTQ